jgi:hypothetical protein
MSSQEKDAEILALRHQLLVLQRQLGPDRVWFTPADRTLLATLLHGLPRDVLKRLRLVVSPDTVFRWHRDVRASARAAVPARAPGSAAHCALDPRPGAAAGPREFRVGVSPGPWRAAGARVEGRRFYRRDGPGGCRLPGTISDQGPGWEVPGLFDTILAEAGIETLPSGVWMPRMNSIMERRVQTCQRELLERPTQEQHKFGSGKGPTREQLKSGRSTVRSCP